MTTEPDKFGGRRVLAATILASGMGFIAGSAVNVALPAIQSDLGLNGTQMLWTTNMFALLLSAFLLVGGSLGDHYGRTRMFALGTLLFGAASVLCGLAGSAGWLIGARGLQGIGGALMIPGSLAVLSATVPEERRGRAIGLWSTFSTLMFALGPALGGWMAQVGWWQGVFWMNMPLVVLVLWLIRKVPESRDEEIDSSLDWLGALMITIGLGGLTYGFTEAPSRGWDDALIMASLAVGAAGLVGFVLAQICGKHPMVPVSLFQNRNFSGSNVVTLLIYASIGAVFFFLPLNLIQIQGYPDSLAGLLNLPFVALIALLSPWAGCYSDTHGPRLFLVIRPAIAAAGIVWLALTGMTTGPAEFWQTYLPGLLMLGIGFGLVVAPVTATAINSAPDRYVGAASGVNNALSRIGGVLAVALLGALALGSFQSLVMERTAEIDMAPEVRMALREAAADLGGAQPPPGLGAEATAAVENSLNSAFLDTFRVSMMISAALCALGALATLLLIRSEPSDR